MSELQSCLPHLERDSQHGAFLSILASIHTWLMPLFWIGLASCRTRNRLTSTAHSTKKGSCPLNARNEVARGKTSWMIHFVRKGHDVGTYHTQYVFTQCNTTGGSYRLHEAELCCTINVLVGGRRRLYFRRSPTPGYQFCTFPWSDLP
jgi:hypothetical protein